MNNQEKSDTKAELESIQQDVDALKRANLDLVKAVDSLFEVVNTIARKTGLTLWSSLTIL